MKTGLKLKPFESGFIRELSDRVVDTRGAACKTLVRRFLSTDSRHNVSCLDECAIYLSNQASSVCFW
jgi:hypothetical protein